MTRDRIKSCLYSRVNSAVSQLAIDHGAWIRIDLENRSGMQEGADIGVDSNPAKSYTGDSGR